MFFRDSRPDCEKVYEVVSKGYCNPHPEKTLGYSGAFLFYLLDVYVSDELEQMLAEAPQRATVLMELLCRLKRDDYGDISEDDKYNNIESRYIAGSAAYMTACYETDFAVIRYDALFDAAILYIDGENISLFKSEQEAKRQKAMEEYAEKLKRLK